MWCCRGQNGGGGGGRIGRYGPEGDVIAGVFSSEQIACLHDEGCSRRTVAVVLRCVCVGGGCTGVHKGWGECGGWGGIGNYVTGGTLIALMLSSKHPARKLQHEGGALALWEYCIPCGVLGAVVCRYWGACVRESESTMHKTP
jgi:hypothetical protein